MGKCFFFFFKLSFIVRIMVFFFNFTIGNIRNLYKFCQEGNYDEQPPISGTLLEKENDLKFNDSCNRISVDLHH